MRTVCVLMSCFNRRDKTLACLDSLAPERRMLRSRGIELQAVLLDDGSTDGTAEAVAAAHPWVTVVRGPGQLYWCRGMYEAQQHPVARAADWQLWLNDDVLLVPDFLAHLLDCEQALRAQGRIGLVVGATCDARTGRVSYGGERRLSRWRRSRFTLVAPTEQPQLCDSMNGNIVLLPRDVRERVGELDPAFEHAMGDTDYALRTRALGLGVWLAPGFLGTCSDNPRTGTYHDRGLPWNRRWQLMLSRKGLPWRSWRLLMRRHMGLAWPLYFAWPYLRLLLDRWRRPRP